MELRLSTSGAFWFTDSWIHFHSKTEKLLLSSKTKHLLAAALTICFALALSGATWTSQFASNSHVVLSGGTYSPAPAIYDLLTGC
jgi:hypothetical protein